MPIHFCEFCQYTTSVKCNYDKHLKTNLHQKNVSKCTINDKKMYQNVPSVVPKCTIDCTQMYHNSINEHTKNDSNNNAKNVCEFCQSKYKYPQGLYRHKKYCKETSMKTLVKELEEKDKELEEKEKQIEEMKKQLETVEIDTNTKISRNCHNKNDNSFNNTHSNNTINNTINNINILPYVETDSSHLTDKDFLAIVNRVTYCVMDMIEKVHFNPNKKENMNLRLTNLKDNLMMVFEKDNWTTKYKNDVLETLYVEKEMEIEDWIREEQYKYPNAKQKFDRYLNNKESDETMNKVKDDIKLMMYNKTREYKI